MSIGIKTGNGKLPSIDLSQPKREKGVSLLLTMSLSKTADLGRYADTLIQLVRLYSQIRGKVND
jgi:hypothetical protein